jgi:2,4-dienoyl-CoA reductase-like NADH-dependent reductase (Old Yellow Enzyme family)
VTGAPSYAAVFEPIRVGGVDVPNRVMLSTHATGLSVELSEPEPGARYGRYLALRARGGAGLVVLGSSYSLVNAHPLPGGHLGIRMGGAPHHMWALDHQSDGAVERYVEYLNRIVAGAQAAGSKVFAQLMVGPARAYETYSYPVMTRIDYLTLSSSQGATAYGGVPARELAVDEIRQLVRAAGQLAAVLARSNLDGVELHAHAGDLHTDFLSPAFNRREDAYGGTFDNRMRFTLETLASVRASVPAGFAVALRFSPFEDFAGGLKLAEGVAMAAAMERSGNLDLINIYGASPNTTGLGTPDMTFAEGLNAEASGQVRAAFELGTPVACGGRISDPAVAESIIVGGKADMVALTRAFIADPDWGRKARDGGVAKIRRCCFANEGCMALRNATRVPSLMCTVNPEASHEWEITNPAPASPGELVLVVGGGPAGLKAAEQAAMRGYRVRLVEARGYLGGQVTIQARCRARALESVVTEDLAARLQELGVEITLGTFMDAAGVRQLGAHAVVLATGSEPVRSGYSNLRPELSGIPGADRDFVCTDVDVLEGTAVGRRVLVAEDSSGGDGSAPTVVEYLLDEGHEVTVLTTDTTIGRNVLFRSYRPQMARLYRKGMTQHPHTGVHAIGDHCVTAFNSLTDTRRTIDRIDTVVLVLGRHSRRELFDQLRGDTARLHEAGDAVLPRSVGAAILEGYRLGRSI